MKLKRQIIISFIAVSVFIALVGLLGLYATNQVVDAFQAGEEHFGSIIEASNEISSYAKRAEGHTMLFLTLHDETDRKKLPQRIASLREQIAIIDARAQNPDARKILEDINSKTNELESIAESLFKAYDDEVRSTGKFEPGNHEELIRKLDDTAADIRSDGLNLTTLELNLENEHNARANQEASSFFNVIFIISGAAVIGGLVLGNTVSKTISNPIIKLKDAAIDMGRGDFTARIETDSADEIGELTRAFNKMAKDLKKSNDESHQAEENLKKSLKEKETLLREIHHRVKNNLQIISSLLTLQSQYIKDNNDATMLTESQNRIISMSLIHEKLYQSKDLAKIDFKEYTEDLVTGLFQSYGISSSRITLNLDIEKISLTIDSAIPCGLIINELVTNSLKYAFPGDKKGEIKVTLHSIGAKVFELVVSDNGIGIPKELDFRNIESLGLHLVTILVENQLHGEIYLNRDNGTEFQIKFKEIK